MSSWTCYARPVSNGGRMCFHVNTADSYCFYRDTPCCTKCGSTKHASDLRHGSGDIDKPKPKAAGGSR